MLTRLRGVDARRAALVACGFAWVALVRATLAVPGGSFVRRRRRLDGLAGRLPAPPACTIDEAARAVTRAARVVPGARCLEWSLALRGLLAQAGIDAELCIGVAPSTPGSIRAHAWLDCGGRILSWGDANDYIVLQPHAVAP
jgi:hypothetical protein